MRLGLQVPSFTWPGGAPALGSTSVTVARNAEAVGRCGACAAIGVAQLATITPAGR